MSGLESGVDRHQLVPLHRLGVAVVDEEHLCADVAADFVSVDLLEPHPGANCVKIGLPGKLIVGDYFQENRTSKDLSSY